MAFLSSAQSAFWINALKLPVVTTTSVPFDKVIFSPLPSATAKLEYSSLPALVSGE